MHVRHRQSRPAPRAATLTAWLAVALLALGPVKVAHAVDGPGELTIYSTTEGASVEIDGKSQGVLPMASIILEPGQHTIKVQLRGWTDYIDTFEIKPGEELELEIDLIPFAGIVKINTAEPGATVTIDGKIEGVTPFDKDIAVGKKTIVVSRPGYHDQSQELEIIAGEAYNLDVSLTAMPVAKTDDDEFYETWWFWTIVGVAGAGATAAVLLTGDDAQPAPTPNFTLSVP